MFLSAFRWFAARLARGMAFYMSIPRRTSPFTENEWRDIAKLLDGQTVAAKRKNYLKAKLAVFGG